MFKKAGFLFFIYIKKNEKKKKILQNENKQDKFSPFSKTAVKVKDDTAQKIKDFFSKCDQISCFLRI